MESAANANALANAMVLLWFPAVFLFYKFMRPPVATCWAVVGGALILPQAITYDLPGLPGISKDTVPYYATSIVLLFKFRDRLRAAQPLRGVDTLFLLMLLGAAGTVLTNGDPTSAGKPALTAYDLVAMPAGDFVRVYLPFLVGRAMFRNEADLRDLLRFLAIAALICTPFALYETLMTPVFHKWIYGWRDLDLRQAYRMGGWRPALMFNHGLDFSRWLVMSLIATIALMRAKQRVVKLPAHLAVAILIAMVIAARSTGMWILAAGVVPIAILARPKVQRRTSLFLAGIVITYPLLFATGLFPHQALIDFGYSISAERGASLEDRFEQELFLADKVGQQPLFGWGGYGRSSKVDPETGESHTTVDGEWLIIMATRGVVGFLAWFGLYLCPIWVLYRRFKELPGGAARPLFFGACLAIAVMSIDMLLNSAGANPQFFFAGVVYGAQTGAIARKRVEKRRAALARQRQAQAASSPLASPSH